MSGPRRPPPAGAGATSRFPEGSSGPFGEETPGPWLGLEDAAYDRLHFRRGHADRGTLSPEGWFDVHARLG
ncbi:hypothetical protein [Motilibacter aurantiacus]|uniref:hypothetical protein n=1 Tax=Motilibacter aurantiacus TaxID=2714955 RepID=UPI00140D500A|nr:hypothetical protein [Motilibacter aurantiacus]NHC46815.1 hypothetical protein [Motilibacter aurantiacus]